MLKMADNQQRFSGGSDIGRLLRPFAGLVVPAAAVIAALAIGALLLGVFGANPLTGYKALFTGAFGGTDQLAATALKSIPLMLVGVGICIAFRTGVINIGGEGQIIMGAILATLVALALPDVPRPILVPLVMIAGGVGGGIWGAIPGALKAYSGVNEILSTIMMNIIAAYFMSFLLEDLLIEPGAIRIQQTKRLSQNADLPIMPGGTRLHLGIVVALIVAVLGYLLLFRSGLGLRMRAVGHNPHASRSAGMKVELSITQALAFSGACAGIAGAVLVFGSESHRLIGEGGALAFTQSAGFNGIVTALFGGAASSIHRAVVVSVRRDAGRRHLPATGGAGATGPGDRSQRRRGGVRGGQPQAANPGAAMG